jgi:hypothetical protein
MNAVLVSNVVLLTSRLRVTGEREHRAFQLRIISDEMRDSHGTIAKH